MKNIAILLSTNFLLFSFMLYSSHNQERSNSESRNSVSKFQNEKPLPTFEMVRRECCSVPFEVNGVEMEATACAGSIFTSSVKAYNKACNKVYEALGMQ